MTADPFMQLGAVGILGFVLVLVVRWLINRVSTDLRDAARAIRSLAMTQLDMHDTLLRHDAQIRGVNPSAGENPTAACIQASEQYDRILASLESTKQELIRQANSGCP
tara:strand:+ start:6283 stop:6606 length:324 start_codon:yes stop_codon:yes gene_type:complete